MTTSNIEYHYFTIRHTIFSYSTSPNAGRLRKIITATATIFSYLSTLLVRGFISTAKFFTPIPNSGQALDKIKLPTNEDSYMPYIEHRFNTILPDSPSDNEDDPFENVGGWW